MPFLFGLLGDDRPFLLISVCYVNRAPVRIGGISASYAILPTVVVPLTTHHLCDHQHLSHEISSYVSARSTVVIHNCPPHTKFHHLSPCPQEQPSIPIILRSMSPKAARPLSR